MRNVQRCRQGAAKSPTRPCTVPHRWTLGCKTIKQPARLQNSQKEPLTVGAGLFVVGGEERPDVLGHRRWPVLTRSRPLGAQAYCAQLKAFAVATRSCAKCATQLSAASHTHGNRFELHRMIQQLMGHCWLPASNFLHRFFAAWTSRKSHDMLCL